jgi:propionyl-CoA carboxylase alpha chain/3-methylcrotonyl-CoA carboxylase alpha subunit/acetyl-CoA/propionyl-CoA carboxylase biotin carboxyl carrier protein
VQAADLALPLSADVPSAAYLDREQIIACARRAQADAVHPGYGFLSENALFAEQVAAAGLTFIGPDASAMRLLGDKISAREFAVAHGVPVAPSIVGDLADIARRAPEIGYPLLIKAAAGGGGKGMRIVRSADELTESLRLAAQEAERYFRDGRVYAERYLEQPRHIEVQVLGDGQGNAVHLFERECSLQRRYQKIIEESPAPQLPAELRAAMCAAAVRLTAAARYRNAGTVEFVLAPGGEFYFLEMNTRLQVEHPVTECVLGLDLVALQLQIAAGAGLGLTQSQLLPRGHAIECRICAEEPDQDFRPATGRVGVLHVPQGPGVRFDGGLRQGQLVTPSFDSMLGKLIAWAPERATAIERLTQALAGFVLLGVPSNIDYLRRVLEHPQFRAGALHTGFLGEHARALAAPPPQPEQQLVAALAALGCDPDFERLRQHTPEPHASIGPWRN